MNVRLRELLAVRVPRRHVVLRFRRAGIMEGGRRRCRSQLPAGAAGPTVDIEGVGSAAARNFPGQQDTERRTGIAARNELIGEIRGRVGIGEKPSELVAARLLRDESREEQTIQFHMQSGVGAASGRASVAPRTVEAVTFGCKKTCDFRTGVGRPRMWTAW